MNEESKLAASHSVNADPKDVILLVGDFINDTYLCKSGTVEDFTPKVSGTSSFSFDG